MCLEGFRQTLRIVIGQDHGRFGNARRHTAGRRVAKGKQAGPGLHQQMVGVAVIAAFELDQDVATGKPARQADGAHRRLGTGRHQPHHVQRGHQFAQQIGNIDFALGGRAKGQTIDHGFLYRFDHFRVRMTKNHRPPRADVIGIPPAVGILYLATDALLEKQRRATDRPKGAHRRIDAAGNMFLGTGKKNVVT